MSTPEALLLSTYFLVLFLLTLYGAHRYVITMQYYRLRKPFEPLRFYSEDELPRVTVQLPVFNEKYVLERLVKAVSEIDYPRDRLEIQILDDSTDDTQELGRQLAQNYQAKGFDIAHIHRVDRTGYKAGALEAGLHVAKGQLVAVFDADFLPPKDFLRKTVHAFTDPKIGMAQVRWEHINRDYSFLTRSQALFLDGHFVLEHAARFLSGRFFNFNGTAGIWRRECIQEAGGWQHDTITEDLDLSYRAQLAGWRFVYLPDVVAPAELPVEMNAFRTQQHRWAKGSIETARKLLGRVLKSDLPFSIKSEAIYHLTGNLSYLLIVILALLLPVSIWIRVQHNWHYTLIADVPFLVGGTLSLMLFYVCSQKEIGGPWIRRGALVPFALAVGIGISLNNCKAVLEALFGHKSEFTRTPKYNVTSKKDNWKAKLYRGHKTWLPYVELLFGLYFTVAVVLTFYNQIFSALPFLVMFQAGYLYVALSSILQRR
ncbi:glycosyltransferase family 2 protein [Myxococcota bacterium]|nr:glycosyltransferase family 2 protein [Myxococcota bacterium]